MGEAEALTKSRIFWNLIKLLLCFRDHEKLHNSLFRDKATVEKLFFDIPSHVSQYQLPGICHPVQLCTVLWELAPFTIASNYSLMKDTCVQMDDDDGARLMEHFATLFALILQLPRQIV
jgi:hypothetical protein